jgi:acetyl esterase
MVSPHFANVAGLAPAFVVTAGFDPLRDEGEAFARKLLAAGVAVRHVCYTDMIHAFVSFAGGIEAGMEAIEESAGELRKAFSSALS